MVDWGLGGICSPVKRSLYDKTSKGYKTLRRSPLSSDPTPSPPQPSTFFSLFYKYFCRTCTKTGVTIQKNGFNKDFSGHADYVPYKVFFYALPYLKNAYLFISHTFCAGLFLKKIKYIYVLLSSLRQWGDVDVFWLGVLSAPLSFVC